MSRRASPTFERAVVCNRAALQHTLGHALAAEGHRPALNPGTDVGRADIRTAEVYTHVVKAMQGEVGCPMDDRYAKQVWRVRVGSLL